VRYQFIDKAESYKSQHLLLLTERHGETRSFLKILPVRAEGWGYAWHTVARGGDVNGVA
jgi:hypothetical protein